MVLTISSHCFNSNKIFLLSSLSEKNNAVLEVLSETGPEASPVGTLLHKKIIKDERQAGSSQIS